MAYQKTVWKNREVEKPRTFRLQNNPDGTVTLLPAEGNIIEAGTPIIAENMNKIEDAVAAVNDEVAQHLAQNASTTQKGHVQLSNDTNSTSETLAPTMKALNEVKQYANDGKTAVANAVTAKGVSASPSDTFSTLATKIGQIGGGVKSVQRGEFTLSTQSVDIPISSVILGNSIIKINNEAPDSAFSPSFASIRAELLNHNTIRLTRNASSGNTIVSWEVIEFEKVKRIQRGTATVWGNTNIPISSVDLNKTFVIGSFSSTVTDSTRTSGFFMQYLLTSETNLKLLYRPYDSIVHFQIVEF